jgi:hypothetical protein
VEREEGQFDQNYTVIIVLILFAGKTPVISIIISSLLFHVIALPMIMPVSHMPRQ